MQYKVPQNIDLEDKIIGPLTLIQFLYILAGGVVDYLLLSILKASILFWILAIPIALVALALAFLKIQDQPLSHFIKAGFIYLGRPKVRLWQRQGMMTLVIHGGPKKKEEPLPPPKRKIEKSELEKLAYTLDTHSAGQVQQSK